MSTGWRRLELSGFTLSLTLVLTQLSLLVAANLSPSFLFAIPRPAQELVDESRCAPGTRRFDFPCNNLGYYDEEPSQTDGVQVSVIGDSFTVGIVPHPLLLTSVAEDLSGYQVNNFGVVRAGPAEYQIILRQDGLSMDPDVIVIALFSETTYPKAISVASDTKATAGCGPGYRISRSADRCVEWVPPASPSFSKLRPVQSSAVRRRRRGKQGEIREESPKQIDYRLVESSRGPSDSLPLGALK